MISSNTKEGKKVLILGATGFVGKNLGIVLEKEHHIIRASRRNNPSDNTIFFDVHDESTWSIIRDIKPDVVINCIGYGVVKWQKDVDYVFSTNYLQITKFFDFLYKHSPSVFLIQVGSAFEYDLSQALLTESSDTLPRTFYGISKLLASNYLLQKFINHQFVILRPFNMFGPFEDESKIIPALILAQKNNRPLDLTDGLQKRDFFYVQDLGKLVGKIIVSNEFPRDKIINVGKGQGISLQEISRIIYQEISDKKAENWRWGAMPQRDNEAAEFLNGSNLCYHYGFDNSDIRSAIQETIKYYWNK